MGRPSAVMGLQAQFAVRVILGQLLQPVRQSAAVEDLAGTVGRLPEAEDRHEQLMRIAAPLGKLAGAGIGLGCLSRNKPFCSEQGAAATRACGSGRRARSKVLYAVSCTSACLKR